MAPVVISRDKLQGMITVNGRTTKDSGLQVHPYQDQIEVNGELVVFREYIYIMLHKPPGVISATEDTRERTVLDLLSAEERLFEPFPVGRLDKDTEGLLLLTNDGKLAHELLSPRRHVPKRMRLPCRVMSRRGIFINLQQEWNWMMGMLPFPRS